LKSWRFDSRLPCSNASGRALSVDKNSWWLENQLHAISQHRPGEATSRRVERVLRASVLVWPCQAERSDTGPTGKRGAARHASEIRKLHRTCVSKAEIARRLQIGRTSVRRILA
jgi:hypothetical protein